MQKDVLFVEKLHTRMLVRKMSCNPTAEQAEASLRLLPTWRRVRAEKYRMPADRVQSAVAYLLLEELVGADDDKGELPPFSYGANGKPYVAELPRLHFNMSHCRKAVMCAVADNSPELCGEVGCDIEEIPDRIDEDLMPLCFSEKEQRAIRQAEWPELEFAKMWTCKEAFVKMLGTGLTDDLPGLMRTAEAASTIFHTAACCTGGYAYSVCRRVQGSSEPGMSSCPF